MEQCYCKFNRSMDANTTPKKIRQHSEHVKALKLSPVKVPSGAKQIGNYILGKTIGTGTFGKVHLGLHTFTGERVAVKIIEKAKLNSKDMERIYREIQILKKVLHPCLVQLYEIIETEKSLLFVTEYLQNGELFDYIIRKQKLSQEQALRIFQQIISGLEYMHSMGIAHRDLKPENILMDFDGRVKIIDFGLSNQYEKNQKLKTECGSPCYVAPQMIEGKHRYDPLMIDIWSLGIVLFAMLAGYLPFCDSDTVQLYKKVLSGSFKFPTWISADAKDLISKILVNNPNKRATLDQIVSHAWFNKLEPVRYAGINTKQHLVPVQKFIINSIESMNIKNITNLVQSIENNQKNKQTALYYLIVKKLIKEGRKIPTFFGCESFDHTKLKLHKHMDDQNESTVIEVKSISAEPIQNEETPQTNSAVSIYDKKSKQFKSLLKNFMASERRAEDYHTKVMKQNFYANNLDNKKKQQNIKEVIANKQGFTKPDLMMYKEKIKPYTTGGVSPKRGFLKKLEKRAETLVKISQTQKARATRSISNKKLAPLKLPGKGLAGLHF